MACDCRCFGAVFNCYRLGATFVCHCCAVMLIYMRAIQTSK